MRELLDGAGLKTARISGNGIFKDAARTRPCVAISSPARCATGR